MAAYIKHTDGRGNVTMRPRIRNTSELRGPRPSVMYDQAEPGQELLYQEDPFAKYENAFGSIVPPNFSQSQGIQPNSVIEETPPPVRRGAGGGDITGDERYQNFLLDEFINPDTIGDATIDRSTGRMIVPTSKQLERALEDKAFADRRESRLRRGIQRDKWRGASPWAGVEAADTLDVMNAERGDTAEDRKRFYLERLLRENNSNGFAY